MKTTIMTALSCALSIFSLSSYGQYGSDKEHYFKLSIGDGLLVPILPSAKNLSVSFPYSIPDANGAPVASQFNGMVNKPFSSPLDYATLSFELGLHDHFYSLEIEGAVTSWASVEGISMGYGHNWNIQYGGLGSATDANAGLFNIAASINAALVSRSQLIGSFSNNGGIITAFGGDVSPDYTIYHKNGSSSYHSKEIGVGYSQTGYGLMPQLAITTNPFRTHLNLELDLAYFQPIFKTYGIDLFQHADHSGINGYHEATSSNIDKNGVVVKVNDAIYTTTPFNLNSFHIGIKIGISDKM